MQDADRILEVLYDRGGESVWMDELGSSAGVDRAGLEAAIQALRGRGHRVDRGPAGLRLVRPTVLDAHLIERALPVEHIGRHVICFDEVHSTNDVAFDSAAHAGPEARVVTAEAQRAGRGRMGRTWLCPRGTGVLASVLLHAPAARLPPEALTIAAGLAVAEGVDRAAGVRAQLVWPNDVVLDGGKVAGVLVEVRDGRVVVGIGVNVNAAPPPGRLGRAATHLAAVAGRALERIEVCRAVLAALDARVADLAAGRDELVHQGWVSRCGMINRRVRVACGEGEVAGRVLDVSPTRGLVLLTDQGRHLHLPAATSSLLGG